MVYYDWFNMRCGKKCVVVNKSKFQEYCTLVDGTEHFRCSNMSCNAVWVVYTNATTKSIIRTRTLPHKDDSMIDQTVKRKGVRSAVKRKTEVYPNMKPRKLIRCALQSTDGALDALEHKDANLIRKAKIVSIFARLFITLKITVYSIQYKDVQFCFPYRWHTNDDE